MKKSSSLKETRSDRIFDRANVLIMIGMLFIFAWPLWFVLIASFSDPAQVSAGHVLLFPKGISLNGDKKMLDYADL